MRTAPPPTLLSGSTASRRPRSKFSPYLPRSPAIQIYTKYKNRIKNHVLTPPGAYRVGVSLSLLRQDLIERGGSKSPAFGVSFLGIYSQRNESHENLPIFGSNATKLIHQPPHHLKTRTDRFCITCHVCVCCQRRPIPSYLSYNLFQLATHICLYRSYTGKPISCCYAQGLCSNTMLRSH